MDGWMDMWYRKRRRYFIFDLDTTFLDIDKYLYVLRNTCDHIPIGTICCYCQRRCGFAHWSWHFSYLIGIVAARSLPASIFPTCFRLDIALYCKLHFPTHTHLRTAQQLWDSSRATKPFLPATMAMLGRKVMVEQSNGTATVGVVVSCRIDQHIQVAPSFSSPALVCHKLQPCFRMIGIFLPPNHLQAPTVWLDVSYVVCSLRKAACHWACHVLPRCLRLARQARLAGAFKVYPCRLAGVNRCLATNLKIPSFKYMFLMFSSSCCAGKITVLNWWHWLCAFAMPAQVNAAPPEPKASPAQNIGSPTRHAYTITLMSGCYHFT